MKHFSLFVSALLSFYVGSAVHAQSSAGSSPFFIAFRQVIAVPSIDITVPTVVELPLGGMRYERSQVAVYNVVDAAFEPYLLIDQAEPTPIVAMGDNLGSRARTLVDNDPETMADFALPETGIGTVRLVLDGDRLITSSQLSVLLDNYVALPLTIEIRTVIEGVEGILVASKRMTSQTVQFPKTTADLFIVTLTYAQPLRITDIRLAQQDIAERTHALRFLAQPDRTYRVYVDPDRYVMIPTEESGSLSSDEDVRQLPGSRAIQNSSYVLADTDGDGVADLNDNCVEITNADQEDIDGNSRGDACDDFDRDGVINDKDNCINEPNRNQRDTDGDEIGDACDAEESRVTEKYVWLPWLGMGLAAAVLVGLIILMMKPSKTKRP